MAKQLLISIFILLASACVLADDDDEKHSVLHIDRIDLSRGDIVIGDSFYKLDPYIQILDATGKKLNREFLKAGQEVIETNVSPYRLGYHRQIDKIVIKLN